MKGRHTQQASIPITLIATLGPQGTFSDVAISRFIDTSAQSHEVRYYDSIKQVLNVVGAECRFGVIPIENLSEGFLSIVLDALGSRELYIVDEIALPIAFVFVAKAQHLHDIQKVIVQFAANGQCEEFLSTLNAVQQVMTQSNMESLSVLRTEPMTSGAIVPSHAANHQDFALVVEHVHDFEDNQTRFVVLPSEPHIEPQAKPTPLP